MSMSVFKKTLPLTTTVFINKCGSIGLNLIPMLLVEKHLRAKDAALVMTIIKVTSIGGTFLGSYLCDDLGMKFTLLLSFLLAGIGLAGLPMFDSLAALIAFACVAHLGNAMFSGPMRLLISEVAQPHEQQEAWGWFRTANNVGQIVAFSIGTFFSTLGIPALFYFDAITSLFATGIGSKIIKKNPHQDELHATTHPHHLTQNMKTFLAFAFVTGGFSCLYELFIVSVSANSKIYFGELGVKIYSQSMLINTVICALVAIPASKTIKNPRIAFPMGIVFMGLGSAIAFTAKSQLWMLFLGMLLVSIGEIFYTALSTYVLIRITPKVKKKGTIFGIGLVFQPVGRIIGAAIAFPCVVYGKHVMVMPLILSLIVLSVAFWILPDIMHILKMEKHSLD